MMRDHGLRRRDDGRDDRHRLSIVKGSGPVEEFVRAHADGLPARVTLIHGLPPRIADRPILSRSILNRAFRKAGRLLWRREWEWEITSAYLRAFRRDRPNAVLAEFGQSGVVVLDACQRMGLPLIVHFHGADVSKHAVLHEYGERYRTLFREARAVVAVSRAMVKRLISLGAPPEKVHWSPCGVDCGGFSSASPADAAPVFLAVGRFVEKKAPHLTILAFAEVLRRHPQARLRMIGDGPLLDACRDLARRLDVAPRVTFLEAQPHPVIQEEMRRARAFVQHSVVAGSGDSEGTPVAILEAGASGLPVVATRHGGIPDVVLENGTGLLVDEHDVTGMAEAMLELIDNPTLAAELGAAARDFVGAHFSMEHSLRRLWKIIAATFGAPAHRSSAPPSPGTMAAAAVFDSPVAQPPDAETAIAGFPLLPPAHSS
jgi:colanic acid/amylovoran biosynthesis glycosyltransferase